MKTSTLFIFLIMATIVSHQVFSQITQLELVSGNNKTDFTLLSVKSLDKNRKFSFSTLAFYQKYHHSKDFVFDEVGVKSSIFYSLTKSISIGPTFYYNSVAGFTERLTLLISKRTGKFTYTINPALVHSNISNDFGGELFIEMQYMQPIKNEWHFLTYTKLLTSWRGFNIHERSYQYLRIGLSKNNNQFGFALNFDEYGNIPIRKNSIGMFIRKNFMEK